MIDEKALFLLVTYTTVLGIKKNIEPTVATMVPMSSYYVLMASTELKITEEKIYRIYHIQKKIYHNQK